MPENRDFLAHFPWPNPEAFSICPWQQELLDGLLGADLIGFHVSGALQQFSQARSIGCSKHGSIGNTLRSNAKITGPRCLPFPDQR